MIVSLVFFGESLHNPFLHRVRSFLAEENLTKMQAITGYVKLVWSILGSH